MGYNGACRREEITHMLVDDVQIKSDVIIVLVPKTKTYISREFFISDPLWIELIKKYRGLRPDGISCKRFFLTYRKGHCINGLNTIGKVPKIIAEFLKLSDPHLYTGHCFRRSSVTQLANKGTDLVTIKRHGGWKSSSVAEGYIDCSKKRKIDVANLLSSVPSEQPSNINVPGSSSDSHFPLPEVIIQNTNQSIDQKIVTTTSNLPGVHITAQDTCSVIVKVYNNCTIVDKEN